MVDYRYRRFFKLHFYFSSLLLLQKTSYFKTICNNTQLKQQNHKGATTFAAHRQNVNVLLKNSTFLIFAVVWCRSCCCCRLF